MIMMIIIILKYHWVWVGPPHEDNLRDGLLTPTPTPRELPKVPESSVTNLMAVLGFPWQRPGHNIYYCVYIYIYIYITHYLHNIRYLHYI